MAINTEFIDFIVPIETIRRKYPGGWEQCLQDHAPLLGGRVWHDDYLLRDGAMNPMDMQRLVQEWESMGFTSTVEENGRKNYEKSRPPLLALAAQPKLQPARAFRLPLYL